MYFFFYQVPFNGIDNQMNDFGGIFRENLKVK